MSIRVMEPQGIAALRACRVAPCLKAKVRVALPKAAKVVTAKAKPSEAEEMSIGQRVAAKATGKMKTGCPVFKLTAAIVKRLS